MLYFTFCDPFPPPTSTLISNLFEITGGRQVVHSNQERTSWWNSVSCTYLSRIMFKWDRTKLTLLILVSSKLYPLRAQDHPSLTLMYCERKTGLSSENLRCFSESNRNHSSRKWKKRDYNLTTVHCSNRISIAGIKGTSILTEICTSLFCFVIYFQGYQQRWRIFVWNQARTDWRRSWLLGLSLPSTWKDLMVQPA